MNRQLTLEEKWKLDIESYNMGSKNLSSIPICEKCKYSINGNVFHCEKYIKDEKPEYVVFPSKECPQFIAEKQINIKISSAKQEKLFGGIFGFILGDAMGVPMEFSSRQERLNDPVKEMRAYGTHHQPYGTWSDDTSLSLCLIQNIIEGYSLDELSKIFIKYYRTGYLTPYGEIFDIGNTTQKAIKKMIRGIKPEDCGGKSEQDNGNGSLMRILPLSYYLQNKEPEEHIKIIETNSSLTHGHKRAKLACIIYVEIAINLLNGFDKKVSFQNSIEYIKKYCKNDYSNEFEVYRKIITRDIFDYTKDNITSTGYVVDTLEAVIWIFMSTDTYISAILSAINLGGDTDTISALTGGLAGIFYGFNKIPNQWIQYLEKKNEIVDMLKKFGNVL